MFLAVDIGNTNIVLGVFNNDKLIMSSRVFTRKDSLVDEYAVLINDALNINNILSKDIDSCVISSVVPKLSPIVKNAVNKISGCDPIILSTGIKTGINIKIDNPAQLGSDMVANAAAAVSKYKLPAIVIDLGTAMTFSVIDEKKSFLGGIITAGVRTALDGLTFKTSQLQDIDIVAPKNVIGTNTIDCMKSGFVFGYASMIDGFIDRIVAEKNQDFTIIATGGMSSKIIPHCLHQGIIIEPDLMLWGLLEIQKKNIQ